MMEGACDCHAHIIGPISDYPMSQSRLYTPEAAGIADYKKLLSRLGFDRGILVQPSIYGTDNTCTAEALAALGPSFRGVAVVSTEGSREELLSLHKQGFRGARMNLVQKGGPEQEKVESLAERLLELNWHLQIYAPGEILPDLLERPLLQKITVVVDHLGQPDAQKGVEQASFQKLLRQMEGGHIWVKLSGAYRIDVSGSPYARARPFAKELIRLFPERLLWGTDWPHVHIQSPTPEANNLLRILREWCEDDEETLQRILVKNPSNLFQFEF